MNLVRSWPQGQAGPTPLGWRLPQPLMPPRVNGWPMGVVPSSDAEGLLESAVAWWDASRYRAGDRFLRNQGVAGELLDLRLGSSIAANSNDPTWLGVQDSGYVYLPGVVGNYLSVPDENALDITGDIDIRVRVAMDDWTPAGPFIFLTKTNITPTYWLRLETSGVLTFGRYQSAVSIEKSSTVVTGIADGAFKWVRVTMDVDNGAAGNDIKFWTADDDGTGSPGAWTQLGTTVTTAGTASIDVTTSILQVGAGFGTYYPMKFYRAIVKNGIDGPSVLDVDCNAITSGSQTSFQALTGQTVTINRSTSGRKSVTQPGRGRGRATFLLGTDDYFEVPADRVWQNQLLNFGRGDSFTLFGSYRLWDTITSTKVVIGKKNDTGPTHPGYSIRGGSGFCVADGTTERTESGGAVVASGGMRVTAGVWNGIRGQSTLNGVDGDTSGLLAATFANKQPLVVGKDSGVADYADMEFTAAAIFRRALTQVEIASITRYYGA